MCLVCQNEINNTITKLTICPNVTDTQLFELSLSGRLDSLRELYCWDCASLQTLPLFPNLQKLDCGWCERLQTLPNFPNLRELYCRNCTGLQTFPLLPNLRILYCGYCTGLQTLPIFPNLQILHCWECTGLQTLPLLPNLQELNCRGWWMPQYYLLYIRAWTDESFRKGMYTLCQVWKTWNTKRKKIRAVLPLPKVLLEKII